jgi:hypothetical protein
MLATTLHFHFSHSSRSAFSSFSRAHLLASARFVKVRLRDFPSFRTVACHFPLFRFIIGAMFCVSAYAGIFTM